MRSPPSYARLSALAFVTLALPASALADEAIPTVTLTEAGPDRSVPASGNFYVAGEVGKDVEMVRAIVVRTSSPWLLAPASQRNCRDVEASLGRLRERFDITSFQSGTTSASDIWSTDESYDALVTAAWTRPKDAAANAPFRVLVDHDPAFFRTGASFCLFVFKRERKTKVDSRALPTALLERVKTYAECAKKKEPEERHECTEAAELRREKEFEGLVSKAPSDKRGQLEAAIQDADSHAVNFARASGVLRRLLEDWTAGNVTRDVQIPAVLEVTGPKPHPLGLATRALLARRGAILVSVVKTGGTPKLAFFGPGGKPEVGALSIQSDDLLRIGDEQFRPSSQKVLEVKAAELILAGAATANEVTLRDLLEVLRGRVRYESRYVGIDEISKRLATVENHLAKPSEAEVKAMGEVAGRMKELSAFIDRATARKRSSASRPDDATVASIEYDIGKFLVEKWPLADGSGQEAPLVACAETTGQTWFPTSRERYCRDPAKQEVETWPGFTKNAAPFYTFATQWENLTDARSSLLSGDINLETVKVDLTQLGPTLKPRVEFTQRTWVFSYLTPVTGAAIAVSPADSFAVPYIGAQLHLVPNPVDKPMWTNGARDFARLLALEAGMVTGTGPFGADDRYGGPSGFPPVVFGLASHPLPYTSLTLGGMILERRLSTLKEETPTPYLSLFVGLNVQANIPDLVSQLTTTTAATSAAK